MGRKREGERERKKKKKRLILRNWLLRMWLLLRLKSAGWGGAGKR